MHARNFAKDIHSIIYIYLQEIEKPCPSINGDREKQLIHLESQLTLTELKLLLNSLSNQTNSNLIHPDLIFKFFAKRWERIKNTRAAYPYNPYGAANLACKELAIRLNHYYPEGASVYRLLMPTLKADTNSDILLYFYILNDDNTTLINVKDFLIQFVKHRNHPIIIREWLNCFSFSELKRIHSHSKEIKFICNLIKLNINMDIQSTYDLSLEDKKNLIYTINLVFENNQYNQFLIDHDEKSKNLLFDYFFGEKTNLAYLAKKMAQVMPSLWPFYLSILTNEELVNLVFQNNKMATMLNDSNNQIHLLRLITPILENKIYYKVDKDLENRAVLFILLNLYLRLRDLLPNYTGFFGMITGYAKNKKIEAANWLSNQLLIHSLNEIVLELQANAYHSASMLSGTLGVFMNQIISLHRNDSTNLPTENSPSINQQKTVTSIN